MKSLYRVLGPSQWQWQSGLLLGSFCMCPVDFDRPAEFLQHVFDVETLFWWLSPHVHSPWLRLLNDFRLGEDDLWRREEEFKLPNAQPVFPRLWWWWWRSAWSLPGSSEQLSLFMRIDNITLEWYPNSKNVNSENFSSRSSFSNLAICDSMRFGYWKYLYNHIESNSHYYWMENSNQNHHSCTGQGWCHLDKNRHQKINCFGPFLSVLQYIDNPGNTLYLCMAHSNLLHQNCSFHCWSNHCKTHLQPMDL